MKACDCDVPQAEQDHQKAQLPGGFPAWSPGRVQALIGVSGVYNCFDLADHFNSRGLYRRLFDKIMSVNGRPALKLFSPTYCIKVLSLPFFQIQNGKLSQYFTVRTLCDLATICCRHPAYPWTPVLACQTGAY